MAQISRFTTSLLQWRLQEEAQCRKRFLLAQQSLDVARTKVAAYEDAMAECLQLAQGHFATGDEASGVGCQREAQGLLLQRTRWASKQAASAAVLEAEREALREAIQCRKALRLGDTEIKTARQGRAGEQAGAALPFRRSVEKPSTLAT